MFTELKYKLIMEAQNRNVEIATLPKGDDPEGPSDASLTF